MPSTVKEADSEEDSDEESEDGSDLPDEEEDDVESSSSSTEAAATFTASEAMPSNTAAVLAPASAPIPPSTTSPEPPPDAATPSSTSTVASPLESTVPLEPASAPSTASAASRTPAEVISTAESPTALASQAISGSWCFTCAAAVGSLEKIELPNRFWPACSACLIVAFIFMLVLHLSGWGSGPQLSPPPPMSPPGFYVDAYVDPGTGFAGAAAEGAILVYIVAISGCAIWLFIKQGMSFRGIPNLATSTLAAGTVRMRLPLGEALAICKASGGPDDWVDLRELQTQLTARSQTLLTERGRGQTRNDSQRRNESSVACQSTSQVTSVPVTGSPRRQPKLPIEASHPRNAPAEAPSAVMRDFHLVQRPRLGLDELAARPPPKPLNALSVRGRAPAAASIALSPKGSTRASPRSGEHELKQML